jgi:hypothetical protein
MFSLIGEELKYELAFPFLQTKGLENKMKSLINFCICITYFFQVKESEAISKNRLPKKA